MKEKYIKPAIESEKFQLEMMAEGCRPASESEQVDVSEWELLGDTITCRQPATCSHYYETQPLS